MLLQHTAPAATTAQLLLVLRPPSRLPAHRHRQPKRAGMAQCRPAAAAATGSDAAAAAADGDRDGSSGSKQATPAWPALRRVLFNAPNSVGWVRLGLLLAAVQQAGRVPKVAAWLFVANMLLDAADGWLARTLQQATAFGAVLDVLLDVAMRGWLWVNALPPSVALAPPLLEMTVFAFTHKVAGADWKTSFFAGAPGWVRAVMAGGLRSPAGAVAVAGLMGCPLWAWACGHLPPGHVLASPAWGVLLVPARALAGAVELWVVGHYLAHLLRQDAATAGSGASRAGGASAGGRDAAREHDMRYTSPIVHSSSQKINKAAARPSLQSSPTKLAQHTAHPSSQENR